MRAPLVDKLSSAYRRLPPRSRQYVTATALAAGCVGLLWVVFSLGSSKPTAHATDSANRTKPTPTDLMAPGQQVDPLDQWVDTAGRKLDQYENDRAEQQRLNRERQEFEARTMARFNELERKLAAEAAPAAAAAAAGGTPSSPSPIASTPQPAATGPALTTPSTPASPGTVYPPDDALPRNLPPRPTPMSTPVAPSAGPMPAAAAIEPAMPPLLRVAVYAPTKPTAASSTDAGPRDAVHADEGYLPVGFTRGILLGGIDAPTGGQSQSNPQPVIIRLTDPTILPNRYLGDYRECFVIAAGYGDIGSERAYLRTETLSCVRDDGRSLEIPIQGSIFGEDGKLGLRGRVVSKQGQMLANALLAGVVGGIGQGLSTGNTTYSSSALGAVSTTTGADAYRNGVGAGVGRALDRLAQYYIRLAEQTFPVVEIDAGREVDVVITRGTRIEARNTGVPSAAFSASPSTTAPNDPAGLRPDSIDAKERYGNDE